MGRTVGKVLKVVGVAVLVYAAFATGTAPLLFGMSATTVGSLALIAGSMLAPPRLSAALGDQGNTTLRLTTNPVAARPILYGKAATGGNLVFRAVNGTDGEDLHLIVALAGHEIDSFDGVKVGPDVVTFSGNNAVGTYADKMFLYGHLGTDNQTADTNAVANCAQWTTEHRLRGVAYTYMKLVYDAEIYQGGLPQILYTLKGRKIYDPRMDSTNGGSGLQRFNDESTWAWSENPILCAVDYLKGVYVNSTLIAGMGVSTALINWGSVIAEANICDEQVALKAGGTENRYTANGWVNGERSHRDNINSIMSACAGNLVFQSGEWVFYAAAARVATKSRSGEDIIGPISLTAKTSTSSKINGVKGRYSDPQADYALTEYPQRLNTAYMAADGGVEYFLNLDLPMTKSETMAQRIALIALEKSRMQQSIPVTFSPVALEDTVMDTITFDYAPFNMNSKKMLVADWKLNIADVNGVPVLTVQEHLVEEYDYIYDWTAATDELDGTTAGIVTENEYGKGPSPSDGTTANWSEVVDDDFGKPEDNATASAGVIPQSDTHWTFSTGNGDIALWTPTNAAWAQGTDWSAVLTNTTGGGYITTTGLSFLGGDFDQVEIKIKAHIGGTSTSGQAVFDWQNSLSGTWYTKTMPNRNYDNDVYDYLRLDMSEETDWESKTIVAIRFYPAPTAAFTFRVADFTIGKSGAGDLTLENTAADTVAVATVAAATVVAGAQTGTDLITNNAVVVDPSSLVGVDYINTSGQLEVDVAIIKNIIEVDGAVKGSATTSGELFLTTSTGATGARILIQDIGTDYFSADHFFYDIAGVRMGYFNSSAFNSDNPIYEQGVALSAKYEPIGGGAYLPLTGGTLTGGLTVESNINAYIPSIGNAGTALGQGFVATYADNVASRTHLKGHDPNGEVYRIETRLEALEISMDKGVTTAISIGADNKVAFLGDVSAPIFQLPQVDGGSNYLGFWAGDTDWVSYMSQSGQTPPDGGGATCTSIDGRTGYHIRHRVASGAQYGYLWETNGEACLMNLTADTGNLFTNGNYYPTGQSTKYLSTITGGYGTLQCNGSGGTAYEGFSIDGRAVFMHDGGGNTGLWNDVDDEWLILCVHNDAVNLHFNGVNKAQTTNTGFNVSGTLTETSDRRLKENIIPIKDSLGMVLEMHGYTHGWKNQGGVDYGFIADELQKIAPELVTVDANGMLAVSYTKAVPILVEAIKEQQQQIDELKKLVGKLLNKDKL